MATVVKKGLDENEDKLIARFRRKVQSEQILIELRDRQFHKPPSVKKKEKLSMQKRDRSRKRRKK